MLKVTCINKIRDKRGIITHYNIQDVTGKTKIVTAQSLKEAIRNKKVNCVNLILTSDNRLISKVEKQQTSINRTSKIIAKIRALGMGG